MEALEKLLEILAIIPERLQTPSLCSHDQPEKRCSNVVGADVHSIRNLSLLERPLQHHSNHHRFVCSRR